MGVIRSRVIAELYGDGIGATIAGAVADRTIHALKQSFRNEPELLDVSTLVPGERYVITTRPAPDRKERKLEKRAIATRKRLDRATALSRKDRRAVRELAAAREAVVSAAPGSRRERRAARAVVVLTPKVHRATTSTPRSRSLQRSADDAAARLERHRESRLAKARRRAPRPRERVFR